MSLGKWTNAFVAGTNENNLSLANINLDFSLVKVTVPEEFLPLGRAMSLQRRQIAEEGPVHQTARRLGALFSHIAPKTPKLVKAFGQRVSEIMQTPGASPQGSAAHGPFRNFVGADATSIWASATSGPSSISVLLLACMLARQIDDPKISVALWVQIISIRQAEIRMNAEMDASFFDASILASQQHIAREDIAAFDASVRSWLSVADQVMARNQKQLDIILQNLTMPYMLDTNEEQYIKIISAWKNALDGFESLLAGQPQEISESSLLVALSAWHLYPCLLVLSTEVKRVDFNDKLFLKQAVITVGLLERPMEGCSKGFRWSVALSHLKYYGDPVHVEVDKNTRVTVQELELIVLGALLSHWMVPIDMTEKAISWIANLGVALADRDAFFDAPAWFTPLERAANNYLSARNTELDEAETMIRCGRRRADRILPCPGTTLPAFFGLTNPHLQRWMALPPGRQATIEYARSLGESVNLSPRKSFLAFTHSCKVGSKQLGANIIATIVPHQRLTAKRNHDDNPKTVKVHARWITFIHPLPKDHSEVRFFLDSLEVPNHEETYILPQFASEIIFKPETSYFETSSMWVNPPKLFRHAKLATDCDTASPSIGACFCLGLPSWRFSGSGRRFSGTFDPIVLDPDFIEPKVFGEIWRPWEDHIYGVRQLGYTYDKIAEELKAQGMVPAPNAQQVREHIEEWDMLYERNSIRFMRIEGSLDNIAICISEDYEDTSSVGWVPSTLTAQKYQIQFVSEAQTGLNSTKSTIDRGPHHLNKRNLGAYLRSVTQNTNPLAFGSPPLTVSVVDILEVLSVSAHILSQCSRVTLPMKLANVRLNRGKWLPRQAHTSVPVKHLMSKMSRSDTFACICMLESGGLEIDPSHFDKAFALSAGNSIYVAKAIMNDPTDKTEDWSIVRIVGNIGLPGISIIVSPEILKLAEAPDDPRAVEHQPYDNRRVNSFPGVTMHLSMTEWRVPIPSGAMGLIDQDVFLTEAVVSVHDGGKWYADIDVLGACKATVPIIEDHDCTHEAPQTTPSKTLSCIDTFDELLELPLGDSIFRAHGNWTARLAAVCIWRQTKKSEPLILIKNDKDHNRCWGCLEQRSMQKSSTTILVD